MLPPGWEGFWRTRVRSLLPPRVAALLLERDWLEAAGWELRCEEWLLLRLTELSPLVLPDWLALRFCEEGAETEEAGRLPPLLRELPLPDPLRELLPPLV